MKTKTSESWEHPAALEFSICGMKGYIEKFPLTPLGILISVPLLVFQCMYLKIHL